MSLGADATLNITNIVIIVIQNLYSEQPIY